MGAFLLRQLYFNSKIHFTTSTKVVLLLTVLLNIRLVFRYINLSNSGSIWWSLTILNGICLYFLIFLQMGQEFYTFSVKTFKWRQELVFNQRFNKADGNETLIRTTLQSMVEQMEEEFLKNPEAIDDEEYVNL